MRIGALLAGTIVVLAVGCGGGDLAATGGPRGRPYGTDTWFEASLGESPEEIAVRFDGPVGEPDTECHPERQVAVEPSPTEVRLTVKRYAPSPIIRCAVGTQTATAILPEPLGDRPLVNPQTGWRFRTDGGRLVLDPDSTPCGRADCSAPAPVAATCNALEYQAIVAEQLPGRSPTTQPVACDGSFLVVVRDGRRGWFVNRQAGWRLAAQEMATCDEVWRNHRIRFPAAFCAPG